MTRAHRTKIAVIGLGAAGLAYAQDLGGPADVIGYDPARSPAVDGVVVAGTAAEAAAGADLILALTPAPAARAALDSVLTAARPGAVYADLSSSSPQAKAELASVAEAAGLIFADAVIMAPVAAARSATPIVASGAGARRLAGLLRPLGVPVEVLDGPAGEAAARKLLRSVVIKGLTALLIEAQRSAQQQGLLEWFGDHITDTLTGLTPEFLRGLLDGTEQHSARRVHEMAAAVAMIESGGDTASLSRGTLEVLQHIDERGIPRGGALS